MSTRPLDELYFAWLYGQVADQNEKNPAKRFWNILSELFHTEFIWLVPNDDNRAGDGKELRMRFILDLDPVIEDREWTNIGCSFLEVMVGLSHRLSFEADGEARHWFWELMENLGLDKISDARQFPKEEVDNMLERVMFRNYKRNGEGGLFPLRKPSKDQRKVELWYQLGAYVLERDE